MRFSFFAIAMLFLQSVFADISTIVTFEEAKKHLQSADSSTLVVFDVDEVLIISEDLAFRPCAHHYFPSCLKGKDPKEIDHLISIMQNEINFILIEPSVSSLIQSLQEKGVKTMALTACRTGKFGVIEKVEDWRIDQLQKLSIDFSRSWENPPPISFEEFRLPNDGPFYKDYYHPLFKNGILFGGDFYSHSFSTKGILLGAFFDKMKWKPKKVIFFDDRLSNVLAVEEEMTKRGIACQGFHFLGMQNLQCEFNEEIADLQYSYLAEKKKWLSDKEARKLKPKP